MGVPCALVAYPLSTTMMRTLLLALAFVVICQGRNLIREKREAKLRKRGMDNWPSEEPSEMPSEWPSDWPSGSYPSGSYPSGSPVSGYFSDWFWSVPSEEPSEEADPIDDSTFRKVAHKIARLFNGGWEKRPQPKNDEKPRPEPKKDEKPRPKPQDGDKPKSRDLHF